MPRSSASAPTPRGCSPSTDHRASRCWRCCVAGARRQLLGFVTSFLVLRGTDLTRIMVTLGVALVLREIANQLRLAHRRRRRPAGRHDQAAPRPVPLRHVRPHRATSTASAVLFVLFVLARRIVNSPFGLSLRGDQEQSRCAPPAIGIPVNAPAGRDLHDRRGLCRASPARCSRRPRVRLARRLRLRPLGRPAAGAHHRRHRLSLRRARSARSCSS